MKSKALAVSTLLLAGSPAIEAYDVTDKLSIGGTLAGTVQCQSVSAGPGVDDGCRGGVPLQPELSFRPTGADEFYAKAGFAAGNGLNTVSPFVLSAWAADLEDDVKDINGRNRDYLLVAWYRHEFTLAEDSALGVTFGIINAADYLDGNEYANDEFTQFMNEAFVNGPHTFVPAYDVGGALEWSHGPLSLRGVYMNVGENDDGKSYDFYGAQVGYQVRSSLGEGNYRILVDTTSNAFLNPAGTTSESLTSLGLSFDQQLGETVGAFLRFGWQADEAAVDYDAIYTGGLQFAGSAWGREPDTVGVGLGYLDGGNGDIDHTTAVEAYYRWSATDHLGVTADVQYMKDEYRTGSDVDGLVFGLRLVAEF